MAKKKNAVKSAPNPLRQALLAVKTATLNFSPEHILSLSYDPSSKAMTVKDIPANLESQFTLGESGGGSLDLHPKITMNVTVEGNSTSMINNAIIGSDDTWVVIQGNNVLIEIESLGADNIVNFNDGETKEVTCFVPFDTSSLAVYTLIPERGNLQDITFANCVNCTGTQGVLEITDHTQDASADVTITFTDNN